MEILYHLFFYPFYIMSLIQALFLGFIQGITEFLPVSSSGHLVIFQNIFGLKEHNLFFDVAVHFGTLLAVLIVLKQEVFSLLKGLLSLSVHIFKGRKNRLGEQDKAMARLAGLIVVGLIPTALIGFFFRNIIEVLFNSLLGVGCMLLITGIILWTTRMTGEGHKDTGSLSILDAIIIGFVQGLAIAPGISRSGSTIAFGLFRKVKKSAAVRFSFLLSIPAILGAMVLEWENPLLQQGELLNVLAGTVIAAIAGYICLKLLIRMVQKGHLYYFSPYCWAVGSAAIIFSFILK
jgi:undecaprenyl-diphosphatase